MVLTLRLRTFEFIARPKPGFNDMPNNSQANERGEVAHSSAYAVGGRGRWGKSEKNNSGWIMVWYMGHLYENWNYMGNTWGRIMCLAAASRSCWVLVLLSGHEAMRKEPLAVIKFYSELLP